MSVLLILFTMNLWCRVFIWDTVVGTWPRFPRSLMELLDVLQWYTPVFVILILTVYSPNLSTYLNIENVAPAGFNYHLISVFGSQSTGKSTLLNNLFGTQFSVMSELERRQTTKGIWLSKNKKDTDSGEKIADNILVMDVEGTDGRERGEDQDFERKSALFALATSEVLIVNIWEHQVGLYQGANMGLLKTVFEVNLQLFIKDKRYSRSLIPYLSGLHGY